MKKKIICIVFCIFMVSTAPPVIGTDISSRASDLTIPYSETAEINYVEGSMWTTGPILKIIAEVDLISGPPSKIQKIEKILKLEFQI